MKTLKIGIATRDAMYRRDRDIVTGKRRRHPDEPTVWSVSVDSIAKVLSDDNLALLDLIVEHKPQSIAELAILSGRAKSNLSRTLGTMEHLGIIKFVVRDGSKKVPKVLYTDFEIVMPKAKDRRRSASPRGAESWVHP